MAADHRACPPWDVTSLSGGLSVVLHSLTAMTMEIAAALLGGVGAAVIGLWGPVLLLAWTRRVERRDALEARTAGGVASIHRAVAALRNRLAQSRFGHANAELLALVDAITDFASVEMKAHREVCLWLLDQMRLVSDAMEEVERSRWSIRYVARVEHAILLVAALVGTLTAWHQGLVSPDRLTAVSEAPLAGSPASR